MMFTWWYVVAMVGFLLALAAVVLGDFTRNEYKGSLLAFVGIVVMIIGGVYSSAYRRNQFQKAVAAAEADIKARTAVITGTVYHSVHQIRLNGCRLVLKELPSVTFILTEQDSYGRSCANIKLGDLVDVKYVQPKKKDASNWSMEYVEALDFFDRTDIDPPPHN